MPREARPRWPWSEADFIRLRHILDAAAQIRSFVGQRSRESLRLDDIATLGLVKAVEIIGEAGSIPPAQSRKVIWIKEIEMSSESEAMRHIQSWGRQTIAFAMSLRASELGKPLDDPSRVALAGREAQSVAQDLWQSAYDECKVPVQPSEVAMRFSRRVLDWAAKHRAN